MLQYPASFQHTSQDGLCLYKTINKQCYFDNIKQSGLLAMEIGLRMEIGRSL